MNDERFAAMRRLKDEIQFDKPTAGESLIWTANPEALRVSGVVFEPAPEYGENCYRVVSAVQAMGEELLRGVDEALWSEEPA